MKVLAVGCVMVLMANCAKADIVFNLASFNGNQQTSTFAPGDTATIKLIATDPDGAELGTLYWYGFTARLTASTADPNTASVSVNPTLFTFDQSNGAPFNTSTGSTLAGENTWPTTLSANGDVLASFQYTVTQDTVFKFNDSDPNFNLYRAGSGGLLQIAAIAAGVGALGQQSEGLQVSVPEPTAWSLLVLGASCVAGFRRRR